MSFELHEVEWSDEKVARFWDFQNQYKPFEDTWFTKQVGSGIINFISKHVKIKGTVLDYGTGKGHLVEHILNLNSGEVFGFDFSQESKKNVDEKYQNRENYRGTSLIQKAKNFTPFEDESFDVVFLIEAVEHLTEKYLTTTMQEIKRVLKKDGIVIVTTPNSENLALQHVLCPDCGAIFHRVQHMNSFTVKSLGSLMSNSGFQSVATGATNFAYYNSKFSVSELIKRNLTPFRKNTVPPHLWYIGKRAVNFL